MCLTSTQFQRFNFKVLLERKYKIFKMKTKKLFACLFLFSAFGASAQILTGESFAKYDIDKYDGTADHKQQYVQAAEGLKDRFALDKNEQLSYSKVIECPNQTKDQLYQNINDWFTKAFADKHSSIKTNDAETGTLVVNASLKNIVSFTHQIVNVDMIVKINIKDGKVRLTSTIRQYVINSSTPWVSKKCYPFYDEQDPLRKKVGSSAYTASCVFTEIVEQQLTEAVTPKAKVEDADDDW